MIDLGRTLRTVVATLEHSQIGYVVVGSAAAAAWGVARATRDIDIVVMVDGGQFEAVLAKLRWRLDSRSEVQWRDCVEIASVNDLDVPYLRHWGQHLGVTDDLDDLLSRIEDIGVD